MKKSILLFLFVITVSVAAAQTKYIVYPENYGAVGNNQTDDTKAIQAMFTDAILKGYKPIIPAKQYRISSTIYVKPSADKNNFRLDLEMINEGAFFYYGKGACFKITGLRFSQWTGFKVALTDIAGQVAVDLDTDNQSGSTTNISFRNCSIGLGNGINQVAWQVGLNSLNGGDLSFLCWDTCFVTGNTNVPKKGQYCWSVRGGNTLNNSLINCFGAFTDRFYSNENGGNGACYFFGCGTSQNNLDFMIASGQSFLISGGRFESGKKILLVGQGAVSPAITFTGIQVDSYSVGTLFDLNMPCSLKIDNSNITGNKYTPAMIKASSNAMGTIIIEGGSIECNGEIKTIGTNWKWYSKGVRRLMNNVAFSYFTDNK